MSAADVSLLNGQRRAPVSSFWAGVLDAAKALIFADSARAEFMLAMISTAWGWHFLQGYDTFALPVYAGLRNGLLSENAWGTLLMLLGVWRMMAVFMVRLYQRMCASAVIGTMWLYLSLSMFQAAPEGFSGTLVGVFALNSLWNAIALNWRIQVRRAGAT